MFFGCFRALLDVFGRLSDVSGCLSDVFRTFSGRLLDEKLAFFGPPDRQKVIFFVNMKVYIYLCFYVLGAAIIVKRGRILFCDAFQNGLPAKLATF